MIANCSLIPEEPAQNKWQSKPEGKIVAQYFFHHRCMGPRKLQAEQGQSTSELQGRK